MILQDAWVTFKAADAFSIDAGLMFVPFSRDSLQSAATLLPIDYGAYTFGDTAPEQGSTGRTRVSKRGVISSAIVSSTERECLQASETPVRQPVPLRRSSAV